MIFKNLKIYKIGMWVFCVISSVCAGCMTRPVEENPPSEFLQLPPMALEKSLDTPPLVYKKESQLPEVELFASPDLSGKTKGSNEGYYPKDDPSFTDLLDKNILMEVISHWDDGSSYRLSVQFINPTGEGVNLNLNLYAYDRLGRLLRTLFSAIYFRPYSVMTQEFTLPKRGKEVKWLINLTGKK